MSKKESKIIEADVEVVSSKKTKSAKPKSTNKTQKQQAKKQQANNPFAGMSGMEGMPDLSAMFGKNGMPDLSKMPGLSLKHRITFKLMSLMNSPKLRFLKSKWSMPIWGIIAILLLAVILVAGIIFLIYKLLKAILTPYINLFRKNKRI